MTPPRSAKDVLFSPGLDRLLRSVGGVRGAPRSRPGVFCASAASEGASAVASARRRRPGATAVLAKLQTALTLLVKALLTGRPTDDERLITKRVKQSRHVSKTVFCCAYFCARFVAPAFAL